MTFLLEKFLLEKSLDTELNLINPATLFLAVSYRYLTLNTCIFEESYNIGDKSGNGDKRG